MMTMNDGRTAPFPVPPIRQKEEKKAKKEIICDSCGAEVLGMGMKLADQVLAEDEAGNPVIERYFDCPNCGRHYTVTVMDREMRLMMQKRQQLQKRIARRLKDGAKAVAVKAQQEAARELQDGLMQRASMLKEKYLKVEGRENERSDGGRNGIIKK